MPPKVRVTREDIIRSAVEIVRTSGADALNARRVAAALDCSTQPVFSNFSTMEELRLAVVEAADRMFQEFMQREMARGEFPPYKASGRAYIRFAQEERELFKLLYMRDRAGEVIPQEDALSRQMEGMVQENTGVSGAAAKLFHLEMWACVHGIASMLATGFLELEPELISRMLTDFFQGMKKHYADGGKADGSHPDRRTE